MVLCDEKRKGRIIYTKLRIFFFKKKLKEKIKILGGGREPPFPLPPSLLVLPTHDGASLMLFVYKCHGPMLSKYVKCGVTRHPEDDL